MTDNIIFCANAVFPLIVLIFLGMFIKTRQKLFANPKDFFYHVEKLVFNVALPVFIFNEIAQAEPGAIFNPALVIYCVAGILILCVLLVLITGVIIKDKSVRGAFIQGSFRSNFAILGVPLAGNLFGAVGSATAALVLPFVIVLYNSLAVIILTLNSGHPQNNNFKKIIMGIIKNPLIIAIFIALPFLIFDISKPEIIQRSLNYISNMSTPLALISLGAGVDLQLLRAKIKLSLTASLVKTAISPAVFTIPAIMLGFRNEALTVIFVLFAAPTAVSSYIMAKNMHSDADLAGQILALTTVICPVTIFAGSFILKSINLI